MDWNPKFAQTAAYGEKNNVDCLKFALSNNVPGVCLDFGAQKGVHRKCNLKMAATAFNDKKTANQIESAVLQGNDLLIKTNGEDGYVVLPVPDSMSGEVSDMRRKSLCIRCGLVCILVDIFCVILLI